VELFALGKYLCRLLRNNPAVDDCVKANLRILAPRLQNLLGGNIAEVSQ
jgi:hypothetical protein